MAAEVAQVSYSSPVANVSASSGPAVSPPYSIRAVTPSTSDLAVTPPSRPAVTPGSSNSDLTPGSSNPVVVPGSSNPPVTTSCADPNILPGSSNSTDAPARDTVEFGMTSRTAHTIEDDGDDIRCDDGVEAEEVLEIVPSSMAPAAPYESSDEQSTIGSLHANRLRMELLQAGRARHHSRSDATDLLPSAGVPSAEDLSFSAALGTAADGGADDDGTTPDLESIVVDGGYGWVVVLGAFIGNFVIAGTIKSFGILNISVLEMFKCTSTESALIVSLLITISLLVSPLVGVLCERFSCRMVVVLGGLLSATGFALGATATAVWHLWLWVGVLAGIGAGCITTPGLLISTRYFPHRRSLINGIVLAGNSAGSFALPALFKYLLDMYGLRGTFLLIGVLCLLVVVCGCLFRPLTKHKRRLLAARRRRQVSVCGNGSVGHTLSDTKLMPNIAVGSKSAVDQQHPQLQQLMASRASSVEKMSLCSVPAAMAAVRQFSLKTNSCRSLPRLSDPRHRRCSGEGRCELLIGPTSATACSREVIGDANLLTVPLNIRSSSLMLSTNDVTADATFQFTDELKRMQRRQLGESLATVAASVDLAPCTTAASLATLPPPSGCLARLSRLFDLQLLRNRLFCVMAASVWFMAIATPYAMVQLPVLAVSQGLTRSDAVYALSLVSAVDLVARLTLGWLFDRPGFPRHAAFVGCQLLAAVALMLLPLAGGRLPVVLALSVTLIIGMGMWYINLVPVLADHHGLERIVASYSLVRMFYGLATLVGPPLLGVLADSLGQFGSQYYAMGVTCVLAAVLTAFTRLPSVAKGRATSKLNIAEQQT